MSGPGASASRGMTWRGRFVPDSRVAVEVAAWKANREAYPGWLVLPRRNRIFLWRHTEEWVGIVLSRVPEQEPAVALSWLAELTWRVDRCLLPLEERHVEVAEIAIGHVVPRAVLADAMTLLHPASEGAERLDWLSVNHDWTVVAAALLRSHRENRDVGRFAAIKSRTAMIEEMRDAAAYQGCLLGLEALDGASARAEVEAWLPTGQAWALRRGAILAELGEVREAQEIARQVLDVLRGRTATAPRDFVVRSLEGWALMLLRTTGHATGGGDPSGWRFEGRWDMLGRLRCDPRTELEAAAGAVRVARLDTGGTSPRLDGIGPLEDAYAVPRLLEVAAHPVRAGHFSPATFSLRDSVEVLSTAWPERAVSLLFRIQDTALVRSVLNPHRVAAMGEDLAAGALGEALSALEREYPTARTGSGDRLSATALAAASTLVVRGSEEQADRAVDLAMTSLGRSGVTRDHVASRETRALLRNALSVLPRHRRRERALDVLDLPLMGHDPSPGRPRWYDDISLDVLASLFDMPSVDSRPRNGGHVLTGLGQGGAARSRALVRAAVMHRAGVLAPDVQARIADLVWRNGGDEAWPEENVPDWLLLNLPSNDPSAVEAEFRRRCTSRPLEDLIRREVLADGSVQRSRRQDNPQNDPLENALQVAARPWLEEGRRGFAEIRWSGAEIDAILRSIMAWWDSEGRGIVEQERPDHGFQPAGRLRDMTRFLAWSALSCDDPRPVIPDGMAGLLESAADHGWRVATGWPVLALQGEDGARRAAGRLRRELASSDMARAEDAAFGVFAWLRASRPDLQPPPPDLVEILGHDIRMRRAGALTAALFFSRQVVRHQAGDRLQGFLGDLAIGLDYLLEDTRYVAPGGYEGTIPYAEVPDVRALAAALAGSLSRMPGSDQEVVGRWRSAAADDALPAVREAFEDGAKGR